MVLTLAVKEAYKGSPASTMTIRQFIWDIRDKMDSMGYQKGQEYILFLNPPTKYGLTSTTGLDQGRFRISTDSAGREVVENSVRNYGLVAGSNAVDWAAGSSTSRQNASRPETETQGPVSMAPQAASGKTQTASRRPRRKRRASGRRARRNWVRSGRMSANEPDLPIRQIVVALDASPSSLAFQSDASLTSQSFGLAGTQ